MKYAYEYTLFLMSVFQTSCGQIMRYIFFVIVFYSFCNLALGQGVSKTEWYSETNTNGIVIQNSFPNGGPYSSSTGKNTHYSFLIFFTRVINETDRPLQLTINFPADSFATGEAGNVYMKVFLPPDTMTFDIDRYNAGLESFLDFKKPTMFQKTINPKEECLFHIGTVFYQAKGTAWGDQSRGGNRAELVLKGQDLFYRMLPQIDSLPCGHIITEK